MIAVCRQCRRAVAWPEGRILASAPPKGARQADHRCPCGGRLRAYRKTTPVRWGKATHAYHKQPRLPGVT